MQDSRNDRYNFSLKSVHIYEVCPESIQLPVAHSSCLLNHLNSFHGGMFMLSAKLDADSLLYSLSCFECYGHGVHMLTQQCLPPPLTSTVKYIVHSCAFQSTLLGCQVTSVLHMLHNPFSSYCNGGPFSGQTSCNLRILRSIKSPIVWF